MDASSKPLQAVVLADSFKIAFRPITLERPKVLLPLANVPMISYALEFLASGGVKEVFVYCSSKGDQIVKFIQQSKWSKLSPDFNVKVIVNVDAMCVGDALRHLDQLEVIKSDFVLISGDVITNMKLAPVLAAHRKRAQANPLSIMTLVFKKASHAHRTRRLEDDLVVVLGGEKEKNQLLVYNNDLQEDEVDMDLSFLQETSQAELRYDLMDCHIDICSPQVLMLFTENFDYQGLREHFVEGILTNDLVGHKLHAHVVTTEYAARCQDLRTYNSISQDVIHRWTHPMTPDNNIFGDTTYRLLRGNKYKEDNVKLARSCILGADVVVGGGTKIGDQSLVERSVIGRNCIIGDNVTIDGCYIWDGCTIEDGASLTQAVLCDGVKVGADATVTKGCILSYGVEIGAKVSIPPYSKVTLLPEQEGKDFVDSDDEEEENPPVLAESCNGRYYVRTKANEVIKTIIIQPKMTRRSSFDDDVMLNESVVEEEEKKSPEETGIEFAVKRYQVNSIAPPEEVKELTRHDEDDDLQDFEIQDIEMTDNKEDELIREIKETLQRAHTNSLELDGIVLDMTNIKLSLEATLTDYAMATFLAFFALIDFDVADPEDLKGRKVTGKLVASIKKIIAKWYPVLSKFLRDVDDQMCVLMGLEAACLFHETLHNFFQFLLQQLYDIEIASEEAILKWEELRVSQAAESNSDVAAMVTKAATFLEWLKDDEEDEDEESDEEE